MKKNGFVLVQVLLTAVIVSIIAAGILQMTLLRSTLQARARDSVQKRLMAEAALNAIITQWDGNVCGTGNCGCSGTYYGCSYTTSLVNGQCQISIVSP